MSHASWQGIPVLFCLNLGNPEDAGMKFKTKILLVTLLIVAVVILFAVGFSLLNSENGLLKDASFIYKQQQFISQYEYEPVSVSFLLVDSGEYFKNADENSAKMKVVSSNNKETSVDMYDIETLKNASLISPYALYKITIQFNPEISGDQIASYSSLQINENNYAIGELTIQSCIRQDYPDVGIGSSPFSENSEFYDVLITNRENDAVEVKGIYYTLNNKETNLLVSDVKVNAGEQKDASLKTGFSNQQYTIQPIIEYEYNDKIFRDIFIVPTEYTTSLSKDDILKYIERNGK